MRCPPPFPPTLGVFLFEHPLLTRILLGAWTEPLTTTRPLFSELPTEKQAWCTSSSRPLVGKLSFPLRGPSQTHACVQALASCPGQRESSSRLILPYAHCRCWGATVGDTGVARLFLQLEVQWDNKQSKQINQIVTASGNCKERNSQRDVIDNNSGGDGGVGKGLSREVALTLRPEGRDGGGFAKSWEQKVPSIRNSFLCPGRKRIWCSSLFTKSGRSRWSGWEGAWHSDAGPEAALLRVSTRECNSEDRLVTIY